VGKKSLKSAKRREYWGEQGGKSSKTEDVARRQRTVKKSLAENEKHLKSEKKKEQKADREINSLRDVKKGGERDLRHSNLNGKEKEEGMQAKGRNVQ